MMVVAGCALAVAVIIDDVISDTEHILRRLRESDAEGAAARIGALVKAMLEVRGPMMYATIIIVLAVLPVLFMRGPAAAFFEPLILSYIAAVLASIAVALVVTPALAAVLLSRAPAGDHKGPSRIVATLQQAYEKVAARAVRSPLPVYVLAAVAVGAGYLIWTQVERSMVPSFKETDVLVEWSSAHGTSLTAMNRSTAAIMQDMRAIPGVRNVAAHVGRAVLSDDASDVNSAKIWVNIDPSADYNATLAALQEAVKGHPGMEGDVTTFLSKKMREALTGGEDQITVRVYGHDLKIIQDKATEIRNILSKIEGIDDPKVEAPADKTTIEVKVDLDKARVYGLKPGDVRRAASTLVAGITVGGLFEDQKVFDVVVWGDPDIRANVAKIRDILIDVETPKGTQVRLADVADVKTVSAPGVIRRQGVSRRIDVDADVRGRDVGEVSREVARRIKDVSFPFEYHAEVMGEHFSRRAAVKPLGGYLLAATLIAFLVLQAALGSWRLAAFSFLSVPVILLGCLLAVVAGGGVFSLGSLLGLAAVLALTARNGIRLVRHFQYLEQVEGERFGEGLVARGVRECFGPVATTAIAVLLFFLPLVAFGNIAGLEILHPMGVAVFGGMVMSMLITLGAIPALYLRFGTGTMVNRTLDLQPQAA
jgi:Cu/Ag efflux pump CusA